MAPRQRMSLNRVKKRCFGGLDSRCIAIIVLMLVFDLFEPRCRNTAITPRQPYVWTGDEVCLPLNILPEYEVNKNARKCHLTALVLSVEGE